MDTRISDNIQGKFRLWGEEFPYFDQEGGINGAEFFHHLILHFWIDNSALVVLWYLGGAS